MQQPLDLLPSVKVADLCAKQSSSKKNEWIYICIGERTAIWQPFSERDRDTPLPLCLSLLPVKFLQRNYWNNVLQRRKKHKKLGKDNPKFGLRSTMGILSFQESRKLIGHSSHLHCKWRLEFSRKGALEISVNCSLRQSLCSPNSVAYINNRHLRK